MTEWLADYHIWMSLLAGPHPSPFTRTQRLAVSLLLLLGYAAVNTATISQTEEQVGQIRGCFRERVTNHCLCCAVAI